MPITDAVIGEIERQPQGRFTQNAVCRVEGGLPQITRLHGVGVAVKDRTALYLTPLWCL
jgi:hypothetical protein